MAKPADLNSAATQPKRSAKSSQKSSAKKSRGKAFTPGNPYRWVKGESGNPAGKQGPKISDLLREAMGQQMPSNARKALADLIKADATIGQIIGFAVALKAAGGDLEAVAVIGDRTEGAPEQTIHVAEFTGDDLARARSRAQDWEAEHNPAEPAVATDVHGPAPTVGHV